MDQPRPWQSDREIEAQEVSRSLRYGAAPPPFKPVVTYALLITFGVVWILEFVVLATLGVRWFEDIFTIHSRPNYHDWIFRPWSPFTSTLSHSPAGIMHILFNSIVLYFFGPTIEQILGRRRYIVFFFATGALASIAQVMMPFASGIPALGASGALMGIIGMSVILMPKSKLIIFPVPIPIPLWVGGIAFVILDILGVFNPGDTVGRFAHLSGMAVGLLYGLQIKRELRERGLRLVAG